MAGARHLHLRRDAQRADHRGPALGPRAGALRGDHGRLRRRGPRLPAAPLPDHPAALARRVRAWWRSSRGLFAPHGLRGRALRRARGDRARGAQPAPVLRRRALPAGHDRRAHRTAPRWWTRPATSTSASPSPSRARAPSRRGSALADGDERALRPPLRHRAALPRHPRPPDRDPALAWPSCTTASAGADERAPDALAIVGPTASGKTALSHRGGAAARTARSSPWTPARSTGGWTSARPRRRAAERAAVRPPRARPGGAGRALQRRPLRALRPAADRARSAARGRRAAAGGRHRLLPARPDAPHLPGAGRWTRRAGARSQRYLESLDDGTLLAWLRAARPGHGGAALRTGAGGSGSCARWSCRCSPAARSRGGSGQAPAGGAPSAPARLRPRAAARASSYAPDRRAGGSDGGGGPGGGGRAGSLRARPHGARRRG